MYTENGITYNPVAIPVNNGKVSIIDKNGEFVEYDLSYITDETKITLDAVEYIIGKENGVVISLTPNTIYDAALCVIPLRVIVTIAMANNIYMNDITYISDVNVEAYDRRGMGTGTLDVSLDLRNPEIGVQALVNNKLYPIEDNISALSDSNYRYIYTK